MCVKDHYLALCAFGIVCALLGAGMVHPVTAATVPSPVWTSSRDETPCDDGLAAISRSSHGYIVAGVTGRSFDTGGDCAKYSFDNAFLGKMDLGGHYEWAKSFADVWSLKGASFYDVKNLVGGRYVAVGTILAGDTSKISIVITNSQGDVLTEERFPYIIGMGTPPPGYPNFDFHDYHGYGVQPTRDGGFVVVGSTNRDYSMGTQIYIVKFNQNGAFQWDQTYGGGGDNIAYSIHAAHDGYVVTGVWTSDKYGRDAFLLKLDESGKYQWMHLYGGDRDETACAVTPTADDGYMLVGKTNSYSEDQHGSVYIVKTDHDGIEQWEQTLWRDRFGWGKGIASVANFGRSAGQIITGGIMGPGWPLLREEKIFAIRVSNNGELKWGTLYETSKRSVSQGNGVTMAVGSPGFVVAGARTIGHDYTNCEAIVVKYSNTAAT